MIVQNNDSALMRHASAGAALLLLNYALWWFSAPHIFQIGVVFAMFFSLGVFLVKGGLRNAELKIFVIALLVLCLGSPSDAWDARSIWLFHAKRIAIDNNLFSLLDGYASDFHADYPLLVPSLSASLALAAGMWNELFPKASGIFALLPALYVLAACTMRHLWLGALVLLVGGVYLVNGYMDAILALYFVAVLACIVTGEKNGTLFLLAACMALIKNEGLLLVAVAVLSVLLHDRRKWRVCAALLVAMLPALAWRLACMRAGVGSDIVDGFVLSRLYENIGNPRNYAMLAWYLLGRNALVLLLPLAAYIYCRRAMPHVVDYACGVYFILLVMIYFITSYDFLWQLYTSADRVVLPLGMALGYFAVWGFEKNIKAQDSAMDRRGISQ
jgi:hypothetical protein